MMDFFPHPTDPTLVVLKVTKRYIAKHSDEDLKAAVLAEREACALLCESLKLDDDYYTHFYVEAIRARGEK
jgi:hypothetical protein